MAAKYSLEFKYRALEQLDKNHGNVYHTAVELKMPHQTLSGWNRRREKIYEQIELPRRGEYAPMWLRMEYALQRLIDDLPKQMENAKPGEGVRALTMLHDLYKAVEAERAAEEKRAMKRADDAMTMQDIVREIERLDALLRQRADQEGLWQM